MEDMAEYSINPGYGEHQLAKALATAATHADEATRKRAQTKASRWRQVLAGLADGTIDVGSRTPVDRPAWVTLDVVTGGFATGAARAGGPLRPHERALARALGLADNGDRTALNRHFLTDAGLTDLAERVRDQRYDVDVPEEAALLTVAWLVEHGHADAANDILDEIAPHFATLRFYPIPRDVPRRADGLVCVQDAGQTAEIMRAIEPNRRILQQRESVTVWAPFHDRAVALMLDVVDALPQRSPSDAWRARAEALLQEFDALRRNHRLTANIDDPKTHKAQLRRLLRQFAQSPATLTDGDIRQARHIVDSHARKHGRPGSPQHAALRERQHADVAAPLHASIAQAVASRLDRYTPGEGVDDIEPLVAPIDSTEAAATAIAAGTVLPPSLRRKAERCIADTAQALVERGLIVSGEALAIVLPQSTAAVRANTIDDASLRHLYASTYRAFRRRRSLLLLYLARQVQIEELPWAAAMDRLRSASGDGAALARRRYAETVTLALAAFPCAILPNKLLQEFVALGKSANLELPLTEEVAADIFMFAFTPKYSAAVNIAADVLEGSLYATYYGIAWNEVLAVTVPRAREKRKSQADTLAPLCAARAGVSAPQRSMRAAPNGMILEQQQILTTHNLAALFRAFDLAAALGARLDEMARGCFDFICRRLGREMLAGDTQLATVKNAAYAWRQMLFFASMLPAARRAALLAWVRAYAGEQNHVFRARFEPALKGLEWAAAGRSLDDAEALAAGAQRFLGWTNRTHWLIKGENS